MVDVLYLLLVLALALFVSQLSPRMPPRSAASTRDELAHEALFCLFTLLYKIAQADGAVSEGEVAKIQDLLDHKFEIDRVQQQEVKALVLSWEEDFTFEALLERFRRSFALLVDRARAQRAFRSAIEMMLMVAASDGRIHPYEEVLLGQAARVLEMGADEYAALLARYVEDAHQRRRWSVGAERPPDSPRGEASFQTETEQERYYSRMLGLESPATPEQLQQAYRKAVRKYHPDRVQHLGEELQALAEQKTKAINEAYAWLRARQKS